MAILHCLLPNATSQTSERIQVEGNHWDPSSHLRWNRIGLPGVGGLRVIRVKGNRVCVGGAAEATKDRALALDQALGQVHSGARLPVVTGFIWLLSHFLSIWLISWYFILKPQHINFLGTSMHLIQSGSIRFKSLLLLPGAAFHRQKMHCSSKLTLSNAPLLLCFVRLQKSRASEISFSVIDWQQTLWF